MKAYIKDIGYYVPQTIVTNEQLVKDFPEWSVEKVASKIGVSERHVASEGQTASDLAAEAAERLFSRGNVKRDEVDFVLLCTQSSDYFLPTTACVLQDRLGLSTSCGALDFNLGCSGYIYGLSLAKGLVCAGIARNVLLLTAETYNKYIHPRDKGNRTIFGDGASATIVSDNGIAQIMDFGLGTDGKGAGNLIVKNGGARHPGAANDLTFDENGNPVSSDYLYMNGSEIFNFTLEAVPALVDETLGKNDMKMDEIDFFVFHQANKYMLNFLRKKIGIPEEKFYLYMEKTGNTVSSTVPIALYNAMEEGKLSPGMNILLAGFGVGYSWGGVVVKTI